MTQPALSAEQARALGGPTRRAILEHLAASTTPLALAELTTHLGLNHNAVRKHLAQLVAAELVIEERETSRAARGRPRMLYRLPPAPSGQAPYERLAVLLASALRPGADPVAVGRAAASAAAPEGTAPLDALAGQLSADGFDPVVRRRGRKADIVLQHCPYAAAASANPSAVCGLHLGLTEGAAEAIGGLRIDGLTPKDPLHAGCRVAVTELAGRTP